MNVDKSLVRELEARIPSLKGTSRSHRGDGGILHRCCEIAGSGVNIIVSAILGDPTALIAGVINGLIS